MENLHKVVRGKERLIQSLCKKVEHVVQQEGIVVDGAMHNDLVTIMKRHGQSDDNVSDNFKGIFWQQQLKAASSKDG